MTTTTVITGAWLHSSVETVGECAVVCRPDSHGRPALVWIRDAAGKIQPLGLFTPAAGELARAGL